MAEIKYIVNQDTPETISGVEKYADADKSLLSSFKVNNLFDSTKNTVELHILSLADELLESDYNYISYKELGDAQSAGREGASILTIDPVEDSKKYGYEVGGIKLLYHFLNDLFSTDKKTSELYIDRISEDRTELLLKSLVIPDEDLRKFTENIVKKAQQESYQVEFRVNLKDNNLYIGVNIALLEEAGTVGVVVKLYEPLPEDILEKTEVSLVEFVADSVLYEVDSILTAEDTEVSRLRPANFTLDVEETSLTPSQFYNYDELFSFPVNNTNSQVYSLTAEKGAEISIDYTEYSAFIQFSSAEERLANFKYKLDLINSYTDSKELAATATIGLQGISGSIQYYENLIKGVLNNLDHYERHLYYEIGDTAWPKVNTEKPYINERSNTPVAIEWYRDSLAKARGFDNENYSSLENGIPAYLRDDEANKNLITFIHMLGQHFDNLWIYAKAVTDKYDADNRLTKGVSKDLIATTLRNFGIKIYTSNKSLQDLFTSLTVQTYEIGNEQIETYVDVTAGTTFEGISYEDYQKEVYKRIYHNLPILLKGKGTERGIKALINCFGIPSDLLTVKLYGGVDKETQNFFGDQQYVTSSLGKIRLDNTGSLIEGNTLSTLTSTYRKVNTYTDDIHRIELGFSPTDNVDNYIVQFITGDSELTPFNIDNYIGDPRSLTESNYKDLAPVVQKVIDSLTKYNLQDYVRLLKFFDNIIFKMVKDFLPARSVIDTGLIIKPNVLNRSKIKSVKANVTTGSSTDVSKAFINESEINTAFISGSNGSTYGSRDQYKTTTGSYETVTPYGTIGKTNNSEDKKYNGELEGSNIIITRGELNEDNPYKAQVIPPVYYDTFFYTEPVNIGNLCTIVPKGTLFTVTPGSTADLNSFFTEGGFPVPANTVFKNAGTPISNPYTFTQPQYTTITLEASASGTSATDCTASIDFEVFSCSLLKSNNIPASVTQNTVLSPNSYNLLDWFTTGSNTQLLFEVSQSNTGISSFTTASISASSYEFANTGQYTVKLFDTYKPSCIISHTLLSNPPGTTTTTQYVKLTIYYTGIEEVVISAATVDENGGGIINDNQLTFQVTYGGSDTADQVVSFTIPAGEGSVTPDPYGRTPGNEISAFISSAIVESPDNPNIDWSEYPN